MPLPLVYESYADIDPAKYAGKLNGKVVGDNQSLHHTMVLD